MAQSGLLTKSRTLAKSYIQSHQYRNACFWAEKARTLSAEDPNDTLLLAQILYLDGQYKRAMHMLLKDRKGSSCKEFRYVAALCQAGCQQWLEVLETLEEGSGQTLSSDLYALDNTRGVEPAVELSPEVSFLWTNNLPSAVLLLQGKAAEALGNVDDAIEYFKASLTLDVKCVEALERITHNQYLTCQEEAGLVNSLPFDDQCSGSVEEVAMLRTTYSMMLNNGKMSTYSLRSCSPLESSSDVLCMKAKKHLLSMDVGPCLDITTTLLEANPYHLEACELLVQACVLEKKTGSLYRTAQRLVQTFPNLALSWFAVACYYLLQNNHTLVRKYLDKSLALDKLYVLAWIVYGLSFSENGEYDQAITSYSTASHIMKGSHFPVLYLAKEYYHTGAAAVCTQFLKQAVLSHPSSPAVLQEVGVMFYDAGRYDLALKYMKQALANMKVTAFDSSISAWEPVHNNLGHIYRKLGQLDLALESYFASLQLKKNEPSTHTAIAFVHLLKGDHDAAAEYCFNALRLNRRDGMAIKVLHLTTKQSSCVSIPPLIDDPFPCDKPEGEPGQGDDLAHTPELLSQTHLESNLPVTSRQGFATPSNF